MKHFLSVLLVLAYFSVVKSQPLDEREAIKSFCGCFNVTFEYAETFPRLDGYQIAKPYQARATEYVVLEQEADDKLVLQHLLIINDSTVIKHWRQDWEYEPAQAFSYHGNKTWEVYPADGTGYGQWSQEVYEVDDAPRYAGVATWNFLDGNRSWGSTVDAPLPRREYTTRNDYHVLRRTNRLHLKDWGWVHEQDNEKIVIDGDKRYTLVEEKGLNVYTRTDIGKCAIAAAFWEKHRHYWGLVRNAWESRLSENAAFIVEQIAQQRSRTETLEGLEHEVFANDKDAHTAIDKALGIFMTTLDLQR
jgi:hypothetical protein